MSTVCAWCDKESGVVRPPGTSHGICPIHAAIELNAAKREQIEREIAQCETRVRRCFHRWNQNDKLSRLLAIDWSEDEPDVSPSGKRPDQIVFSLLVLAGSIVLGLLAGAMACAWRFAP